MIAWILLLQSDELVRARLEQLGSPDVEIRQAAETALVAMGEDVVAPLERLAAGADAETRGRVAEIVRRVRWWDHAVLFRGRRIDLRRGSAQTSGFGPYAKVVAGRIVDITPTALRAVDLRTGRERWTREREGEIWGVEAGESSILVRSPKGLTCWDVASAQPLWTSPSHRAEPLAGGDWLVAEEKGLARKGSTSWSAPGTVCFLAAAGPWAFSTGLTP